MNYQEFRCEFLERMKEVMEEGVSITTEKINKNNGVVMEGLVLKSENARVASIFYMEDYFSYWERGVPLEQLVRKVMWQFEHCKPQMDVEADFFQNYQEIKENICFKLINYERNRELLKKVPHKRILDLAMVFYYRIQDPIVDKTKDKEEAEQAVLKQLKPDGIIPLKAEILKHLDRDTTGESMAVPVKYNKNGSVSGYSKVVAGEDFQAMMVHARKKMKDARTKILNGDEGALPYKRGQESGCDYCPYRQVCGFDVKIPGYEYRDIGTTGKEEAMEAMRMEQKGGE